MHDLFNKKCLKVTRDGQCYSSSELSASHCAEVSQIAGKINFTFLDMHDRINKKCLTVARDG